MWLECKFWCPFFHWCDANTLGAKFLVGPWPPDFFWEPGAKLSNESWRTEFPVLLGDWTSDFRSGPGQTSWSLEASVASSAAQMSPVSGTGSQPRGKGLQPNKLSCWFRISGSSTGEAEYKNSWHAKAGDRTVLENLHENTVGFNFQHLKTSCSVFSVCFFAVPWAWRAPALQRAITKSPAPLRKASATVYTYTCFWCA